MIMMPQVCELLYSLRRNGPVLFMQILYIYTILCPVPLGNYANSGKLWQTLARLEACMHK